MLCSMLTWNFRSTDPRWSEIPAFEPIIARSASAVCDLPKEVQLTLIARPLRAFQRAQDDHRTLPLSPPPQRGAQKRKTADFRPKLHFAWRKSYLLQSFFIWKLSEKSCKAFIGLIIRGKMTGGGDPFYLKFWVKMTALERNRWFSIYFRS